MACVYYLLSLKHSEPADGCYTWWRPQRAGYTLNVDEAGIYRECEATDLADGTDTIAVPARIVEDSMVRRVEYGRLTELAEKPSGETGYCPACHRTQPSLPPPARGICAVCFNHLLKTIPRRAD